MAREYISLGSTPCDESCAQTTQDDYYEVADRESKAYIAQLHRVLAANGRELLPGMKIAKKSFPHDFGSYVEVVVYYDPNDDQAVEMAFWLDENSPTEWDNESKIALTQE